LGLIEKHLVVGGYKLSGCICHPGVVLFCANIKGFRQDESIQLKAKVGIKKRAFENNGCFESCSKKVEDLHKFLEHL